ncbi:hypothetical protein B9Z55_020600 [Caenorhabditis nigoni]|nr:hypothetical protein B9Z55_020600 [Caenorhabditis nigoni]
MRILQTAIFFSIFLVIVGQKTSGKTIKPPSSAIHDVTDQLSILSRLVNGIAIQNGFDSNSITPDALLSELLHVGPGNVTLSEIQNLKTEGMAKDYEEIVKSASTMTKGSFGMEEVGSGFEILGKMAENLDMLKEAEALNLTDILEKATSAHKVNKRVFSSSIHEFAENIDKIFDDKTLIASATTPMIEMFKKMVKKFDDFENKCEDLASYKSYLKELWPMIGLTEELNKLEAVASTAKTFNESFILISSSIKKMDELNKELASIDLVVGNLPKMKLVAKNLKSMKLFFESVLSAKLQKRLLTVGFPNGVPDALQLFNDLKSEWVLEKVASKNGKELENMKTDLNGLKKFNKFASLSDSFWKILKTSNVRETLKKSEAIWSTIELTNLSSHIAKNLRTSSSDLSKCFKELNVSSVTLDFHIFEKRIEKLRELDRVAVEAGRLLSPLDKFPVLSNKAVILSLKTELQKIDENSTVIDLEKSMKNIRLNPDLKNLRDAISNASSIITEVENAEIRKPLETLESWDDVSIMQEALENTNLVNNLECLRNHSFNDKGLSQAVNFGSQFVQLDLT